jgi:alpha-galactosidase
MSVLGCVAGCLACAGEPAASHPSNGGSGGNWAGGAPVAGSPITQGGAAAGSAAAGMPNAGQPDPGGGANTGGANSGGGAPEPPACHSGLASSNGLWPTPPMGWSSARLGCSIDDSIVKKLADTLVSSGLRAAGYQYVLLNDCWQQSRDAEGNLVVDSKLVGGLSALADYLHQRQLKLGLGSSRGAMTCRGRPGTEGHESADAALLASAGVDFAALDSCNGNVADDVRKSQFTLAIAAFADKKLPLAIEPYADGQDIEGFQQWMQTASAFRNRGGISDSWSSIVANIDSNADGVAYSRPGSANDPGALQLGGALTDAEYRAQVSLWAVMAAPLFTTADLANLSPAAQATLANPEVIAIDQDALGLAGYRVGVGGAQSNGVEVWSKPLKSCGARAVAFFNRGETAADIAVKWADIGLAPGPMQLRDVWLHQDLPSTSDQYMAHVLPHDAVLLKVIGSELSAPSGTRYLSDLPWLYAANSVGPVERDLSNKERAAHDGTPLSIAGHHYEKGLGVHAASLVTFRLGGACSSFTADVGVDDEASAQASVGFQVWADGSKLFDSGVVKAGTAAKAVNVDVTNKAELSLFVDNGGDDRHQDHVDWANARVSCK